jgi:hypothetical protein
MFTWVFPFVRRFAGSLFADLACSPGYFINYFRSLSTLKLLSKQCEVCILFVFNRYPALGSSYLRLNSVCICTYVDSLWLCIAIVRIRSLVNSEETGRSLEDHFKKGRFSLRNLRGRFNVANFLEDSHVCRNQKGVAVFFASWVELVKFVGILPSLPNRPYPVKS